MTGIKGMNGTSRPATAATTIALLRKRLDDTKQRLERQKARNYILAAKLHAAQRNADLWQYRWERDRAERHLLKATQRELERYKRMAGDA